jgi:hypothetical protein
MKRFVKILKIAGLVFLAIIILIGSFGGYVYYTTLKEEARIEKAELNFDAEKEKWKWHDKFDRIQIYTADKSGKSYLRKVNLEKQYIIYAYKNDDLSLSAMVKFFTDCQPNTEITTSQKYSNGTPKKLKCNEGGNALTFSVHWNGKDTNIIWEENLDGFKLRENFGYWDFTKLGKEITLSKARVRTDEKTTNSKQSEQEQKGGFVIEKQPTPEEYKAINMVKFSRAIVNYTSAGESIRNYLKTIKGYLKILGWKAKKVNDQTYLVSYTYEVDSGVKGYYFDVNMNANVVRRILLEDHELERIYGLIKTSKDDHIDKVPKNNSFSVFTSKDSNVFHKPNCFMLNKQMDAVGYFSAEEAKKKGYMPCNYCTP